ncbi:unnamed protein product, partial [Protopolystoma xenopodis]
MSLNCETCRDPARTDAEQSVPRSRPQNKPTRGTLEMTRLPLDFAAKSGRHLVESRSHLLGSRPACGIQMREAHAWAGIKGRGVIGKVVRLRCRQCECGRISWSQREQLRVAKGKDFLKPAQPSNCAWESWTCVEDVEAFKKRMSKSAARLSMSTDKLVLLS